MTSPSLDVPVHRNDKPHVTRVLFLAGLLLCCSAACVYLPQSWSATLQAGDVAGVTVGTPAGTTGVTTLPGALVSLQGSALKRRSDGDGRFVLRNLPAGTFTATFQWPAGTSSVP